MPKLKPQTWLLLILLGILAVRLVSLPMYPLMDTTEARYAEMARKMLETGNWTTPLFDYDVPFWGKPPLSFWAGAVTMKIFGINEFGARVAPFIASIITGLMFFAWPFAEKRREKALLCFIVMQSTTIGFISAGAVMTDEFLLMAAAICMVAFWRAIQPENTSKLWGYLFFIGLGLGLLAKGPLIFVLAGFPIFWWVVVRKQWRALWQKLPWLTGIILMLALSIPWYWAAENATPGFLRYFIIGEHFERFLVSGWDGDLYGKGHSRMMGTIWWYGFICTLPWILLWPAALWKKLFNRNFNENLYLFLWMLMPLLFFTFARNILPAYVLPGLAAFAVITAQIIANMAKLKPKAQYIGALPLTALTVAIIVIGFTPVNQLFHNKSHKEFLANYWDGTSALVYVEKRMYSGQFYSHGAAKLIDPFTGQDYANPLLAADKPVTMVIRKKDYETLFAGNPQWQIIARQRDRWYMLTNFGNNNS